MTAELAMLLLVMVQTAAILFLARAFRTERRLQAVTRLVAACWSLLDRFARDWMEAWSDPAIELTKGLEQERRELNQSLAAALRYFRREDLNIAFAVKQMVETVESDRLLYLAKLKAGAEGRLVQQVNIHFGPGTNPADLLGAIQRFREGIEEFQELGAGAYEVRAIAAWLKGLRDKLPRVSPSALRAGSASDSIAPGSP